MIRRLSFGVIALTAGLALAAAPAHATSSVGGPITRSEVLARAQYWVDKHVPYSQTVYAPDPQGRGYRSDCSGYVSMAWHLSSSLVTQTLPQVSNQISYDDLLPGDALDKESEHVVLFDHWVDSSHSVATVYTEPDFGQFAMHENWTRTTLQNEGYHAYRYKNILNDPPPPSASASSSTVTAAGESGSRALFARGANGDVVSSWQNDALGDYSAWASLGGNIASQVTQTGDSGSRALFARDANGNVVSSWQNDALGDYSTWANLGGAITGNVTVTGPSGARALFARGASGDVVSSWQNDALGDYSPWVSLGGNIASNVTVIGDSGTRVIYARAANGNVVTSWQNDPLGGYSPWVNFGGNLVGDVTVVGAAGSRVIFGEGTNGDVVTSWQNLDTTYTPWVSLGGHLASN